MLKVLSSLFFALVVCSSSAYALHPAVEYARTMQEKIMGTLESHMRKPAEVRQIVVDEYIPHIDFEWSARMAIGRYWKEMDETSQQLYIMEYSKRLCYDWLPKLNYNRRNGVKVEILDDVIPINDRDVTVQIKITLPDSKIYNVLLRVRHLGENKFKVLDVSAEGVSLTLSYRAQFQSIIESKGGVKEFLSYLIEKNKESEKTVDFKVRLIK